MANRTPLQTFADAIKDLGGPSAAAEKLKRKQPTISGYIKDGNPPADVCMRIEIESGGKYRAGQIRPDLADVFRQYQRLAA